MFVNFLKTGLRSCAGQLCPYNLLEKHPCANGDAFLFSDHGKNFVDPKEKILIGMRESFLRKDSLTEGERNKLY